MSGHTVFLVNDDNPQMRKSAGHFQRGRKTDDTSSDNE
jgi:hypothetical protein